MSLSELMMITDNNEIVKLHIKGDTDEVSPDTIKNWLEYNVNNMYSECDCRKNESYIIVEVEKYG